jgi:hypothetical protein
MFLTHNVEGRVSMHRRGVVCVKLRHEAYYVLRCLLFEMSVELAACKLQSVLYLAASRRVLKVH